VERHPLARQENDAERKQADLGHKGKSKVQPAG
jgi:hypothetical protein